MPGLSTRWRVWPEVCSCLVAVASLRFCGDVRYLPIFVCQTVKLCNGCRVLLNHNVSVYSVGTLECLCSPELNVGFFHTVSRYMSKFVCWNIFDRLRPILMMLTMPTKVFVSPYTWSVSFHVNMWWWAATCDSTYGPEETATSRENTRYCREEAPYVVS